ncbi:tripartite tricarboxylate transporter substrate binding protein [Bordetella petrii]|uniref:tripartite tricarboxylate transporter substrate binding protein n=1 Tax=Bordetella petrii TaxID=94624 RepID=UPI001A9708AC|nr:tripartite tricarboxylate transporter substrate binding protein [Bordetella petrii]MBO1111879.1 tripartite tricarboxylate transporter substrate binding protein [Bordetella petrii]
MKWQQYTRLAVLALAGFALAQPARADFPDKPLRIVVPFAAGGGVDALTRPFAQELGTLLGQTVVVENKASATGQIGAAEVARSAPDGYTLLLSSAAFATTPAFYPQAPYDPVKDFAPITILAAAPQVVVTSKNFKARSMAELVRMAKAGEQINVALSGITGMQALATEMIAAQAGVTFTKVPYKGAGAAFKDLISGEVDVMVDNPASSLPHVRAGSLNLIATTGPKRMASVPDTPTVAETLPGVEARNWFILAAPAGTPAPVIEALSQAAIKVASGPVMQRFFERDGTEVVANSPAQAQQYLRDEIAKWGKIVKDRNLQP